MLDKAGSTQPLLFSIDQYHIVLYLQYIPLPVVVYWYSAAIVKYDNYTMHNVLFAQHKITRYMHITATDWLRVQPTWL